MVPNRRRVARVVGMLVGVLVFGSVLSGGVSSPAVAANGSWSAPVDLSASGPGGNAYFPEISVDAAGNVHAIWYRFNGINDIIQTRSSADGGASWSDPVNLSAPGGNAYSPQISVDAAGNVHAIWSRNDGSNDIVQTRSSADGGASWSTAVNLSASGGTAYSPQISVDAAGNVHAIWYRFNGSNNIVQTRSSADGGVSWSDPVNLSAPGGDAYDPQISVDAAGNVHAIWYRSDGINSIVQVSSLTVPSLADTGITSGAATTALGVGAGLLTAGVLALVLLRRRLARI